MAGSFKHHEAEAGEIEGIAVFHGNERVFRLGARTEVNDSAAAITQFQVAGDEIGVEVRKKHMADLEPEFLGVGQVLLDVALGIDHDRGGAGLIAQQVRSVGEAAEVVLFQNHAVFIV